LVSAGTLPSLNSNCVRWRPQDKLFGEAATVETGDILYMPGGAGHIGMAYDRDNIIHAQFFGDFHKDPDMESKDGVNMAYTSTSTGVKIFRPPWAKCGDAEVRKATLQRVADAIAAGATYGAYRAIRLLIGSSAFGPDAYKRWMKYRERYEANKGTPGNFALPGQEVIKTVTCSEAVIVTYQLTFPLGEKPFFIGLDGAHAMPGTLKTWLPANGWTTVR
jgi:hypothetical protein